jgi:hypothetical protein
MKLMQIVCAIFYFRRLIFEISIVNATRKAKLILDAKTLANTLSVGGA